MYKGTWSESGTIQFEIRSERILEMLRILRQLACSIREEWEALHLKDYLHYTRSMPERVQAVIAARGGNTKW